MLATVQYGARDGIWDYKYDAANRLTVALPWPVDYVKAEAFVYDKNGNRRYDKTAWDYHYDAANRLIENSTYTYTHDANGNLTSKSNRFDNSQTTYAYTPEQQLSDVTTPEHKVQYKYDPMGRRTARTVDGRTIKFVYDGQDIIAELDDNASQINIYTNGPGIDEPLIMTKADGKNYFYHADALGSIKAITDDSGKTIETYKYKAYGQPTIRNMQGQPIPTSLIGNNRMFAAREYEPEIALYNNRHRYLDPSRGAFTQEDPLGFDGGDTNYYSYVKNRPSNAIDPSGKIGWIIAGALISGGIDLAIQYGQTGSLNNIKWGSVLLSAGAGALGVGASEQIAKIGVTAVSRIILNTGAATAISGYTQMAKNLIYGNPLTNNLDSTVATSIAFSALGSSLEEVATWGILRDREAVYDGLPLDERLLLQSNAVSYSGDAIDLPRGLISATGLGISSSGDLYGCN